MTARDDHLAAGIAPALLAGPWRRRQLTRRVGRALGQSEAPQWVGGMVAEIVAAYREPPVDRPRELAAYLQQTAGWTRMRALPAPPAVRHWPDRTMPPGPPRWPITPLPDSAALARLLNVDQGELSWFADLRSWERHCPPPLRHYRWWHVDAGRERRRLVAAPKLRLKEIQRRLLRHVLAPIPLHAAAHGAVSGRSVRTATTPHAGSAVLIRLDLARFFASVPAGRVYGVLRMAGLPEAVAHTVTGLVTTVAPFTVSPEPALAVPHLPQGAPTSPQLANLVAYRLDRRLTELADRFGARYTRYVDDLIFSADRACARLAASSSARWTRSSRTRASG